jgi:hypothetical protein
MAWQRRTATGGASTHTAGGAVAYPNSWVRLDRIGGLVVAYQATDAAGASFQQVGTPLALNVTDPVLVGLCVTSHAEGHLCTAEFRNLSLQAIPTGTGTGLAASYFANDTLSGIPRAGKDHTDS